MGMEVGSRRLCRFLVVDFVELVEVELADLESLSSSSSFFFFFLGTCAGMTGKGVVVRASSGVSLSIHPALARNGSRMR